MHGSTEKHTYVEMSGRWVWRREENRGKVGKKGGEQLPSSGMDDEYGKESKLGGNTGKWGENKMMRYLVSTDIFLFFFNFSFGWLRWKFFHPTTETKRRQPSEAL